MALDPLSLALTAISSVVSVSAGQSEANYRAQVAENNQQIAADNADRAIRVANIKAQEQDFDAQADIGALIARQGASGIALGSTSLAQVRKGQELLAAKDRGFIVNQGEVESARFLQQGEDSAAEGRQAESAGRYGTVSGAFKIGSSLISGVSKINERKARAITGAT